MVRQKNMSIELTKGRVLASNTIWNIVGMVIPLVVAVFAIPPLVHGLGTERFGVLTLAWMLVGYFSLFDLGLGRALTKLVAEKLGAGQENEIPSLAWTALVLMVILGVLGAVISAALSPWLVTEVLKIPEHLQKESLHAFYLLAFAVPFVINSTGLLGILGAYQRFGMINAVRIPLGVFTFIGPLAVLPFSVSLFHIVAVLVAGRIVVMVVYLFLCLRIVGSLNSGIVFRREVIKPLVSFGGWMTISNVLGPIMVYMDRFIIGSIVSMAAVAYYTTPYEMVTKLWLIPTAFVSVLFPAFSSVLQQDRDRAVRLFGRGINLIFLSLFPFILIIVTFSGEGLKLWLGAEFAINSTIVLQLLGVGVFINSLTHVPVGLTQGAGRPDLVAKTHVAELPFYVFILWWLLGKYGIVGVAIAWTVRVTADFVIFFSISSRLLPDAAKMIQRFAVKIVIAVGILAVAGLMKGDLIWKSGFVFLVLSVFFVGAWFVLLLSEDRERIKLFLFN